MKGSPRAFRLAKKKKKRKGKKGERKGKRDHVVFIALSNGSSRVISIPLSIRCVFNYFSNAG